jgi:hypothetical protein
MSERGNRKVLDNGTLDRSGHDHCAHGQPLAIGSGLSVGKEGPSVHVACSFGNIAARLFKRYDRSHRKPMGEPKATATPAALEAVTISLILTFQSAITSDGTADRSLAKTYDGSGHTV